MIIHISIINISWSYISQSYISSLDLDLDLPRLTRPYRQMLCTCITRDILQSHNGLEHIFVPCWRGGNWGFHCLKTLKFQNFSGRCPEPCWGLTAPPHPSWFCLVPPVTWILDPPLGMPLRVDRSISTPSSLNSVVLAWLASILLARCFGVAEKMTMGKKRWLECVQFTNTFSSECTDTSSFRKSSTTVTHLRSGPRLQNLTAANSSVCSCTKGNSVVVSYTRLIAVRKRFTDLHVIQGV